jgi:tetratricopeptide (TPR) repeat protein
MTEPLSRSVPDKSVLPTDGPTPFIADPASCTAGERGPAPSIAGLPSERYTLGEQIAQGGMGVIYRATDTALNREVAIKVLQSKYDPGSGAARRFADEARITAQLQHPGIPPVHDLGALPDGRPFLAMKLIKGQTLEELLHARPEPSWQRGRFVAAFEQVCQALAYAHAHRVIHRDLKPANIMVGAFGEVQVMDWGLAKVLASGGRQPPEGSAPDPDATTCGTEVISLRDPDGSFTHLGSVLGTPAYMPPEQAVGAVGKVDARSDVFGLGAILAVILTGEPPFAANSAETMRVKSAQGDVADCFARLDGCGAEPDLVALCKRCLNPRPAERPAHAGEVAGAVAALRAAADERARRAELERVRLQGEQAAAEARSAEQRKRRRLAIAAALVLAVAVVGGLTAVLVVQRRANARLAQEQARVQARFELAQKAIAHFHTGISEDMLLKNEQFKELRTRLLKEAAEFYGDLEKLLEGQTDRKSRQLLAAGYYQLGDLMSKIGSQAEALAVHRKALAVRRELAAAPGADLKTRMDVARSLGMVGKLLDATGDTPGALAAWQEQRDLAAALGAESLTDAARELLADSNNSIGWVLAQTGKPAEALKAYKKARDIRQSLAVHPANTHFQSALAQSHYNIGLLLEETGKFEEALAVHRKARDLFKKLADANPSVIAFQGDLAGSYNNIGALLAEAGKSADALAAYEKARDIRQKLARAHPTKTQYQTSLANSHKNIGSLLRETGKPAEALPSFTKAAAIFQKLADAQPTNIKYTDGLADVHALRGGAHRRVGQPAAAAADLRRAIELWDRNKTPNADMRFNRSRALALLAGLGAEAKSGVTAAEASVFADQAVAGLRAAIQAGWSNRDELKETDFDVLRKRADFQKLVKELGQPAPR